MSDKEYLKLKEFYIDLELTNTYLCLLNCIYPKLVMNGYKELIDKLPSVETNIKLIDNINIIRFKLLKEIINGTKFKLSEHTLSKFDTKNKYKLNDLFMVFISFTEKYATSKIKNNKEFLDFMVELYESSIIVCIIKQIGTEYNKI